MRRWRGPCHGGWGIILLAVSSAALLMAGIVPQPVASTTIGTTALSLPASGASSTQAEFDQLFIDMMVPHHQAAVAMAALAVDRAEHDYLREIAGAISETQTVDIQQMKAWRLAWYGSAETPPINQAPVLDETDGRVSEVRTQDLAQDVDRLRSAPEPFDRTFLDVMSAHEQAAIDVAQLAEQHAARQEIQRLAAVLLLAYERELRTMGVWRVVWYGPDLSELPRELPFGITPGVR
jgi:uncharacterized protein (DUF305 family)